jgi:hypothetical protein
MIDLLVREASDAAVENLLNAYRTIPGNLEDRHAMAAIRPWASPRMKSWLTDESVELTNVFLRSKEIGGGIVEFAGMTSDLMSVYGRPADIAGIRTFAARLKFPE